MSNSEDLLYRGLPKRSWAFVLDYFVVMLGSIFFSLLIGIIIMPAETFLVKLNINSDTIFPFLLLLFWWSYFAGFESSSIQATLGKRAMRLKVTDIKGNKISLKKATIRFVFKIFLLGSLLVLFTKKKQALHDIIAGTVVIHKDKDLEKKHRNDEMIALIAFIILLYLLGKITP